jgi:acyl-coenzyme A synthetase/AMP-(fatty) acid ligase
MSPYQAIRMIDLFSIDYLLASTEQLLALTRVALKTNPQLNSLRTVLIGGEAPTRALLEAATLHVCKNILTRYGTTELGPIAITTAREVLMTPSLAGHVLPGIELAAFDRNGNRCAPGTIGAIRGRRIGIDTPSEQWSEFGDVGWIASDGQLHVVGRTTEVGTAGATISLVREIEHLIRLEWDVGDAGAVQVGDDTPSAKPQIWIGIVDNPGVTPERLEAIARAHGNDVAIKLIDLKVIPRGLNGKVNRTELQSAIAAAGDNTAGGGPRHIPR